MIPISAMPPYSPRQPGEHWRVTGRSFSIIVDGYIERVKGGRMDRVSVTVCRYDNDKVHNHNWTPRHYGKNVTKATRARLMWAAPLAQLNRKAERTPYEMPAVLGAVERG